MQDYLLQYLYKYYIYLLLCSVHLQYRFQQEGEGTPTLILMYSAQLPVGQGHLPTMKDNQMKSQRETSHTRGQAWEKEATRGDNQ